MIFVDEIPLSNDSPSSPLGSQLLVALMEHPFLTCVSHSLKSMKARKVEVSTQGRFVYIFQREYATVDPSLVDFVGTDEATTCVGIVIRNRKSGMTSVAHMDFPKIVEFGFTQMLSGLVDQNFDVEFDVHILGAFEDLSTKHSNGVIISEHDLKNDGYSFPLCAKIVETLQKRQEKFHVQTLFVLGHNTQWDSQGNAYPIFNGLLVETATGSLNPANFDGTSRCPDEIVRRIRVCASYEDNSWDGKLLETYDTHNDRFVVAPCCWTIRQRQIAMAFQHLSDADILFTCSTSPSAEGPDFVDNSRRQWNYLIQHPDWRYSFPMRRPRVFERTADGGWKRCILVVAQEV
ncbi:hypothetical protein CFOL_v3_21719 [Cephalotus follicularis]|uniref:Protein N-terminal asparagine amidohydrolase n=1 Tax=Cephalotus follicularis TaxID=3775 RepID=A0A1Q3CDT4_CEPFO|nr:hypothetical protein CFOL_v3_21719 [Cephalotus follicularis]